MPGGKKGVRVDTPSEVGGFSDEVADTELARWVQASAIVQMGNYSGHLTRIQGIEPDVIHVVLGARLSEVVLIKAPSHESKRDWQQGDTRRQPFET